MDMANKISIMLNEQLEINNSTDKKDEANRGENETVEEVLTDLIKMDKQDGGIMIDELLKNMTGGNTAQTGKNKKDEEKNQDQIIDIQPKEINENYFEGGNAAETDSRTTTRRDKEEPDGADEKDEDEKDNNPHTETKTEKKDEDDDETNNPQTETQQNKLYDDENEEEDDEDEDDEEDYGADTIDLFKDFLKHYDEKEIKNEYMLGGNEQLTNVKIISHFPYMLRY